MQAANAKVPEKAAGMQPTKKQGQAQPSLEEDNEENKSTQKQTTRSPALKENVNCQCWKSHKTTGIQATKKGARSSLATARKMK